MQITRPNLNDAPKWYSSFFNLATGDDLIKALQNNKQQLEELVGHLPESAGEFKYAENKWTLKQVLIHLCDEERYYAYKVFCYSRQTDVFLEIPMGEAYCKTFNAEHRTIKDIVEEFTTVRNATISLFSSMTTEMLDFKDFPGEGRDVYTARSLGWFAVGHNLHHLSIIKQKYLL